MDGSPNKSNKEQDLASMCSELQKMTMILLNENEGGLDIRSEMLKKPQTYLFGSKYV